MTNTFSNPIQYQNINFYISYQTAGNLREVLIAAELGNVERMRSLVSATKQYNMTDEWMTQADRKGRTPLHLAAIWGYREVVAFIVDEIIGAVEDEWQRKKYLNLKDYKGRTPLDFAADVGRLDLCILFYKHITGDHTILKNMAIEKLFHLAADNGSLALAKLTCRKLKLENYNPKDENGLTPLHKAAKNGLIKVFEYISDLVVDENPAGTHGWTPLHWAARNGHHEIVSYLIDTIEPIENINPTDLQGYTPLHFAAQFGHLNVYQMISDALDDKNPGGASKWNYTPLHLAAERPSDRVARRHRILRLQPRRRRVPTRTVQPRACSRPRTACWLLYDTRHVDCNLRSPSHPTWPLATPNRFPELSGRVWWRRWRPE